jgi:hypothetical protein
MVNERESSLRSRHVEPPESECVGNPTTVDLWGVLHADGLQVRLLVQQLPDAETPKTHRDKEDTYVGRILRKWNVETSMGPAERQ